MKKAPGNHLISPETELEELVKKLSFPLDPKPTGMKPVLPPPAPIRAVIFDIYGTLLVSAAGDIGKDSAIQSTGAFLKAALDAGLPRQITEAASAADIPTLFRQEIEACHARLRSQGTDYPEVDICSIWRAVIRKISPDTPPLPEATIRRLAVSYECRSNPVWPMPGMSTVLNRLSKEKGCTKTALGIVSNAQFYTPIILKALAGQGSNGLPFAPDLCAWSWQSGHAKPSTEIFRPVHEKLVVERQITPAEILYVGNDMLKDIKPATELGWKTALFAGDRRSLRLRQQDPALHGVRPWSVITNLLQLLDLVASS